ncbi:ABC transporter ATP-binding protein [Candidatus Poribacteria bacterium]|nr:ABC transporter ATP-binding protein [Candidatus Poribacteria bacterium]
MVYLENISQIYRTQHYEVKPLSEVSLQVKPNEFVVVLGPSGSGKTTLLLTIGGMLRPTEGRVIVDKKEIYKMSERARAKFRAANIGFVFQMFYLVPYLNVIENVLLAFTLEKGDRGDFRTKQQVKRTEAKGLLKRLRLSEREHHKPSELSTGEQQRTAVARAMFNRPKIILADEPTGNLDPENATEVIGYLSEFHRNGGTVIVATHGRIADQYADRIIHLREGRVED